MAPIVDVPRLLDTNSTPSLIVEAPTDLPSSLAETESEERRPETPSVLPDPRETPPDATLPIPDLPHDSEITPSASVVAQASPGPSDKELDSAEVVKASSTVGLGLAMISETPYTPQELDLVEGPAPPPIVAQSAAGYRILRHHHGRGQLTAGTEARTNNIPAEPTAISPIRTRSHCPYHKLHISISDSTQQAVVLVPACAFVDQRNEPGSENLGEASPAEQDQAHDNVINEEDGQLSPELFSKLHRMAGESLHQGHCRLLWVEGYTPEIREPEKAATATTPRARRQSGRQPTPRASTPVKPSSQQRNLRTPSIARSEHNAGPSSPHTPSVGRKSVTFASERSSVGTPSPLKRATRLDSVPAEDSEPPVDDQEPIVMPATQGETQTTSNISPRRTRRKTRNQDLSHRPDGETAGQPDEKPVTTLNLANGRPRRSMGSANASSGFPTEVTDRELQADKGQPEAKAASMGTRRASRSVTPRKRTRQTDDSTYRPTEEELDDEDDTTPQPASPIQLETSDHIVVAEVDRRRSTRRTRNMKWNHQSSEDHREFAPEGASPEKEINDPITEPEGARAETLSTSPEKLATPTAIATRRRKRKLEASPDRPNPTENEESQDTQDVSGGITTRSAKKRLISARTLEEPESSEPVAGQEAEEPQEAVETPLRGSRWRKFLGR